MKPTREEIYEVYINNACPDGDEKDDIEAFFIAAYRMGQEEMRGRACSLAWSDFDAGGLARAIEALPLVEYPL